MAYRIKGGRRTRPVDGMPAGCFFMYGGSLFMKVDGDMCFNFSDGEIDYSLDEADGRVVDVAIEVESHD